MKKAPIYLLFIAFNICSAASAMYYLDQPLRYPGQQPELLGKLGEKRQKIRRHEKNPIEPRGPAHIVRFIYK